MASIRPRKFIASLLACTACAALAQGFTQDPDWKEAEAPLPTTLNTAKLIKLEMPRSTLNYGVDPASVRLDADGIVRYVVVATSSSGAVNAFQEGIRCNTGEFRTYARYNPGSGWVRMPGLTWRSMHDGALPSKHTLLIARNGACVAGGTNTSAERIVRDLSGDANWRFTNN
ncbi:MAG: CNP1-like family protein [Ramlibacter sp.]